MLRTVGGELALAAAVLLATGVLTGLPPEPNAEPAGPAARPLVVTGADFATTTRVRLEISPGTVGPNTFVAGVTDYDSGEPVDARRVSLTFDLPDQPDVRSTLPLERTDGSWRGQGTALAQPGTWTVTVLVEGSGGSVEVPLQVTPTMPGQHVDISKVPGQPTLYTITLEGGLQIQAYVDPGEPGRTNQVHVTAFDADGDGAAAARGHALDHATRGRAVRAEVAAVRPGALRGEHRPHGGDVVVRRHGPCRDRAGPLRVVPTIVRGMRGSDRAEDVEARPDRRDGVRPGRLRELGRRRERRDRRDLALLRPPEQHREARDRRAEGR